MTEGLIRRSELPGNPPSPAATPQYGFDYYDADSSFADCNLALIFYDTNGYRVIDTNTAQKGQFVSLSAGQKARAPVPPARSPSQTRYVFRRPLAWQDPHGSH